MTAEHADRDPAVSGGEEPPGLAGHGIGLGEATRVWGLVALNSFGGPAGQIAVMHRFLIEERRWFSEKRFLHSLNYCMLLPGPEAQQLATYFGWLLHGTRGGLIAGGLFVLPGFLAIMALSVLYAGFGDVTAVEAIFYGIKPAVMAIVAAAVVRIGSRALKNRTMYAIAGAAFVAIFFLDVPFPFIIAGAGVLGFFGGRRWPDTFDVIRGHTADDTADGGARVSDDDQPVRPSTRRSLKVLAIGVTLWFAPIVGLAIWTGRESIWVQQGTFFSTAAVVTFGGAYSVLAYLAQQAVQTYGWLAPGEMLDGLGMAETTPGPLIQVVQFVGFMGAYRADLGLDPMLAGVLGAILTTWVTFVPCFLWIFLGAPYIEYLRGNHRLTSALSAITAAVVGVVLNLAVWFSLHTIFGQVDELHAYGVRLYTPESASLDPLAAAIATAAFFAMFKLRWSMLRTLAVSAGAGALLHYLVVA
ncbi:chromate efflux transporter [Egicoccus sp. AB-alg2]|uniref:chromate efflux transporter n=1 Tax=Egicoccus sp. AB-alg2 TaxID=3242693 RepID=UPI00359DA4E5